MEHTVGDLNISKFCGSLFSTVQYLKHFAENDQKIGTTIAVHSQNGMYPESYVQTRKKNINAVQTIFNG